MMGAERKTIELLCVDCGCIFLAKTSAALRCPECREERLRFLSLKSKMKKKNIKLQQEYKKNHPTKMSLGDVLKAMDEYNRKHNTFISYGKFIQMMED